METFQHVQDFVGCRPFQNTTSHKNVKELLLIKIV